MKVARFSNIRPQFDVGSLFGGGTAGGPAGQVPTSNGSNVSWGSNVATIFANGSNQIMGPAVNFAAGSNILFTFDGLVGSQASNTIRIHSTGGGGVSAVTSNGSNSLTGTINLVAGTGIALGVSGQTITVTSLASSSGGGAASLTVSDEGTPLATSATTLDFVGAGVTASGTGATKTITIPGSSSSDPIEDAFGTPDTAFEFDANDFTGLTAMGTADVESMDGTVAGHLLIADDDSTQVGRYASVSTPCTGIVKITDFVAYENYQYVGMMFGEATPGNIETVSLLGGATPSLVARTWAPFSTGSPGSVSITRMPTDAVGHTPWYIGVRIASSTDISWYVSRSGVVWQPLVLNRNPGITIASLGVSLGNYAGGTQPRAAGCYDYIRIWNSAKTFPAFS